LSLSKSPHRRRRIRIHRTRRCENCLGRLLKQAEALHALRSTLRLRCSDAKHLKLWWRWDLESLL